MSEREIIVRHKGETYDVVLEIEVQWVDDSFDHDWGGRRQTEECGHWEIDWEGTNIISCTNSAGEEVEVCDDSELVDAVEEAARDIDFSDWD
jgi:hypothetical protein